MGSELERAAFSSAELTRWVRNAEAIAAWLGCVGCGGEPTAIFVPELRPGRLFLTYCGRCWAADDAVSSIERKLLGGVVERRLAPGGTVEHRLLAGTAA